MRTLLFGLAGLLLGGMMFGSWGAFFGLALGASVTHTRVIAFFAGRQVVGVKAAFVAGKVTKAAEIVSDVVDGVDPATAVLGVDVQPPAFCSGCGAKLAGQARFCAACGRKVEPGEG